VFFTQAGEGHVIILEINNGQNVTIYDVNGNTNEYEDFPTTIYTNGLRMEGINVWIGQEKPDRLVARSDPGAHICWQYVEKKWRELVPSRRR